MILCSMFKRSQQRKKTFKCGGYVFFLENSSSKVVLNIHRFCAKFIYIRMFKLVESWKQMGKKEEERRKSQAVEKNILDSSGTPLI